MAILLGSQILGGISDDELAQIKTQARNEGKALYRDLVDIVKESSATLKAGVKYPLGLQRRAQNSDAIPNYLYSFNPRVSGNPLNNVIYDRTQSYHNVYNKIKYSANGGTVCKRGHTVDWNGGGIIYWDYNPKTYPFNPFSYTVRYWCEDYNFRTESVMAILNNDSPVNGIYGYGPVCMGSGYYVQPYSYYNEYGDKFTGGGYYNVYGFGFTEVTLPGAVQTPYLGFAPDWHPTAGGWSGGTEGSDYTVSSIKSKNYYMSVDKDLTIDMLVYR